MSDAKSKAAIERLESSRERLREVLIPPPSAQSGAARQRPSVLSAVSRVPLVNAALRLIDAWWARQPARPVAQLAYGAFEAAMRPIARQHPLSLLLVSAAVGGLLAWSRPWRWVFSSALVAGTLPRLVLRSISTLPFETLASIFVGNLPHAASEGTAMPRPPKRQSHPG